MGKHLAHATLQLRGTNVLAIVHCHAVAQWHSSTHTKRNVHVIDLT
jgi:hypothetical protein